MIVQHYTTPVLVELYGEPGEGGGGEVGEEHHHHHPALPSLKLPLDLQHLALASWQPRLLWWYGCCGGGMVVVVVVCLLLMLWLLWLLS